MCSLVTNLSNLVLTDLGRLTVSVSLMVVLLYWKLTQALVSVNHLPGEVGLCVAVEIQLPPSGPLVLKLNRFGVQNVFVCGRFFLCILVSLSLPGVAAICPFRGNLVCGSIQTGLRRLKNRVIGGRVAR
jgi:hypothetical protein